MTNEAALLEAPEPTEVVEKEPTLREAIEDAVDEQEQTSGERAPEGQIEPAQRQEQRPAPAEGQQIPAGDGKPAEAAPAKGAPEELRAPAQWKPAVREKWNTLPREVKEEIIRREGDSMRLIGSVGPKIRMADEVVGHLQPFAEQLNANGVSPSAFLGDVFTTVKSLSSGNPQEKAEVVANIVQSYGVDLGMLDQILSQRVRAGPEVVEARRLAAKAAAVLQQNEGAVQHQSAMEAQQALVSFGADPKHEFLDNVRDMMADLIESGRVNSLEDAYSAAVWAHPEIRKILLQREAQQRASVKSNRAAQARRASSAIHGSPALPSAGAPAQNLSLRDTISAAMEEHEAP